MGNLTKTLVDINKDNFRLINQLTTNQLIFEAFSLLRSLEYSAADLTLFLADEIQPKEVTIKRMAVLSKELLTYLKASEKQQTTGSYYSVNFARLGNIDRYGVNLGFTANTGKCNNITLNAAEFEEVKTLLLTIEQRRG